MKRYRPVGEEYRRAHSGLTFARLDRGVIRGTGADRLDLLHRLSTGEIGKLKQGEEGTTILTSDKGRIIEVLRVLSRQDEILMLLGGTDVEEVLAWLDKYTIMDDFEPADVTDQYEVIGIYGNGVSTFLDSHLSVSLPSNGSFAEVNLDGNTIFLLREPGLAGPEGALALVPSEGQAQFAELLSEAGGHELSQGTLQTLRVEVGRGAIGAELTGDYNPLEAGLVSHVSFTKGCYIGQEVIARLDTYDKVKRRLMGVRVEGLDEAAIGDDANLVVREPVSNDTVGTLTSLADSPEHGSIALGYFRAAYAVPDLEVEVVSADATDKPLAKGKLSMLPFN